MFRTLKEFFTSLFRRDGIATVGKIARYAFSPAAWKWLLANLHYRRAVRASGLVDEEWYRREYPEVAERGIDPVQDFLTPPHPWLRLPNPDFVPREYATMNFDVKACGLPWAVHYAKDGMREGRPVSTLENYERPFPIGTAELRREFPAAPAVHRRTAVFASFSGDGRIKETVLLYLRGLREVVDNIVFIANSPVFPEEVAKLEGLVRLAVFHHHGCYDFGSYKSGWNEAKALGLLEPGVCDELVVCNDSCFGPVFPFADAFSEMARRCREAKAEDKFDFWGMTAHELFERPHIQSYFYVFGKAVLESGALDRFLGKLEAYRDRGQVVYFCETMLSVALVAEGHRFDSLVPASLSADWVFPPIKYPVTLFAKCRMPLLKAKTLKGESMESLVEAMEVVRRENPALAAILPPPPQSTAFEERKTAGPSPVRLARESHAESFPAKAAAIREAAASGRPVRLLFLSTTADPFPGGNLAASLSPDPRFRARAAVVPDERAKSAAEKFAAMRDARAALLSKMPADSVARAECDFSGEWCDLAADADVVCYGTAADASNFRYNPHYSVGRDFLPVLFFDRRTAGPYSLDKEFARQNYAYFWKILFADREAFDLYASHSLRKGANAVLAEGGDVSAAFAELVEGELCRR